MDRSHAHEALALAEAGLAAAKQVVAALEAQHPTDQRVASKVATLLVIARLRERAAESQLHRVESAVRSALANPSDKAVDAILESCIAEAQSRADIFLHEGAREDVPKEVRSAFLDTGASIRVEARRISALVGLPHGEAPPHPTDVASGTTGVQVGARGGKYQLDSTAAKRYLR